MRNKDKYLVSVDYQSKAGNPLTRVEIVRADNIDQANEILINRVRKQKNCLKVDGGSAEEIRRGFLGSLPYYY